MTKPKVSVIIPVYNTAEYVGDCLDSLLNQNLKDIEIICVDDGSTDDSLFILKKYAEVDKRIIILQQENKGAGVARNYGMSVAKGEYLSFLDSDDFFAHDLLKETTEAADQTKADIVVYRFERFNHKTGEYNSADYAFRKEWWPEEPFNYSANPAKIFNSFNPCTWNKLFRYDFVKRNQLFFQDNKRTNDMFFTCTALACAKQIYLLDKVFAFYRIGFTGNSQSTNTVAPWDFYKALMGIKNFLETKGLYPELEESYKNLVKSTCIYNINNNKEQNLLLYEELKKERFKNLGIEVIPTQVISREFHEKYLDQLYFKHINAAKEECKATIVKKAAYDFIPKVTVIIPAYNVGDYILECLDSIVSQTLKEIEIFCVNDGSTDNTLERICNYAEKDSRIQVINQSNRGLSEARNTGVRFAKGEFLYFIDGDDYLEAETLQSLYTKAVDLDLDIVYFDADSFLDRDSDANDMFLQNKLKGYVEYYHRKGNYDTVLRGVDMFVSMKKNNEYRSSACLQFIRHSFCSQQNLAFYPGILHEDNLFSLPAILLAERTGYIHKSFYKRRVHAESIMTSKESVKNLYGYLLVFCEIQKFLDQQQFDSETTSRIMDEVSRVYVNSIARIYTQISEDEKCVLYKKLSIYQEIQLKHVLQLNQIKELNTKNKNLEQKNTALTKDAATRLKQIQELQAKNKEQEKKNTALEKEKERLVKEKNECEKQRKHYVKELANVKNGYSFRIGRVITYFPRKVRGGMRCFKQHGFTYTVKRTIEHLGIDMGTGDFGKKK